VTPGEMIQFQIDPSIFERRAVEVSLSDPLTAGLLLQAATALRSVAKAQAQARETQPESPPEAE